MDGGVRGVGPLLSRSLAEKKNVYPHRNNLAQVFHVIDDENEAQTGGLTKASEKARTGSEVF